MNSFVLKTISLFIVFAVILSSLPELHAARFVFKPKRKGAEAGLKFHFGAGSNPEESKRIKELKNEETGIVGIGLMVLGACLVAAAVVVANAAGDSSDDITDTADDLKDAIEDKYEEIKDRFD